MRSIIRNILSGLAISLIIASALIFAESFDAYKQLDLKLYDLQMSLRPPPMQSDDIIFIEMDDDAIAQLGRWPWPRDIFADIINTLNSLGARQILFDVTFSQPSPAVINKEGIEHIFKGKKEIVQFIENEKGLIPNQNVINPEEISRAFNEVQQGFETFTETAYQKLQYAITDHDITFSNALNGSDVFIGYAFEIVDDTIPLKSTFAENSIEYNTIKQMLANNIETTINDAANALNTEPENIRELFNLLKTKRIKILLHNYLENNKNAQFKDVVYHYEVFDQPTQKFFKDNLLSVKNEIFAQEKFSLPLTESQGFLHAIGYEPPYYQFTNSAHNGGFLNGIPNSDGVLRQVPLFVEYKNRLYPQIAVSAILEALYPERTSFIPNQFFVLHNAHINNSVKDLYIPINSRGEMLINWVGKWQDSYQHLSASRVYYLNYLRKHPDQTTAEHLNANEKQLQNKINNRICIIGLTATGTHDFNPIPYESTYPMVGTHGNIINSILTNQFITKASDSTNLTILLALALLLGLTLAFVSSISAIVFSILIFSGVCGVSFYLFTQGLWINLASPILLCLFTTLGVTSYKFSTEEKDKRKIKKAFAKYISPDIIEEISKDPSKLQLGGTRRELTVLFSDIRGFTTYSEKRNPEEVVAILNEYLDAMTQIIFECKGTLDKYVGDEIMAVFGAPQFAEPHICAKRAVITGILMLKKLKELQAKWKSEGLEPLDIGIGANSGEMVVGNMGSELRMDYTVIGDSVNLGARIEALTRDFNCSFIISESTYQYVESLIDATPLEPIKVKGKEVPVMIYKVNGLKTDQYSLD